MKHTLLNKFGLGYMLLLILGASCSKDTVSKTLCEVCKPANTQTFNYVAINNWVPNSNGRYISNLDDIMKDYLQSYNEIFQVELQTLTDKFFLESGNDIDYASGKLELDGSNLIYISDSHFQEFGLPPSISSMHLNVTVLK